ncbi:MAG: tetrahydrofolate dehydrogenase/cyclohydrolase catalytic domain-containing protein [Bacteroidota bacterium]
MAEFKIIDGKLVATAIKSQIATKVKAMIDAGIEPPHLAAILVGNDPASETYVKSKEKSCQEVGFLSSVYRFPENTSETKLLEAVNFLNDDPEVDGFIVQLPLPKHIAVERVLDQIKPSKDVDGFHAVNVGRMVQGLPGYLPATPMGIVKLIEHYKIETSGKHCVVLGRSQIVGTPVSLLMSRKGYPGNATVTLCHSQTENLTEIMRSADILIAAIGSPLFVKADMVKKGAVVIDVGIHRIPSDDNPKGYVIVGDVDYDQVAAKCSWISPVPGGVGPMTIVSLLLNTLSAAEHEIYKETGV